jgi:hypothetical protein
MNNFEIIKLCKRLKIPLKNILSKDELYNIEKEKGNYIINMEDSNVGNGSHWVAMIKRDDTSLYFDSYGFICPIAVIDFLKPSKIAYTDNDIQFLTSVQCGLFCIAFLKYMKGSNFLLKDYNDFINIFSENEKLNDQILFAILKKEGLHN